MAAEQHQSYTRAALSSLSANKEKADKANKVFLKSLKRKTPSDLDLVVRNYHHQVFEKMDCLECANCCRTLGPRISDNDIQRLSKALRMKPGMIIDSYLRVDEDGDYVFRELPCPFLDYENYCRVYESRPKACREYPHTDRVRFSQALDVTALNLRTCPAVFEIVEKLKDHFD